MTAKERFNEVVVGNERTLRLQQIKDWLKVENQKYKCPFMASDEECFQTIDGGLGRICKALFPRLPKWKLTAIRSGWKCPCHTHSLAHVVKRAREVVS